MRELFVERKTVRGEDGGERCFDYYVVIDEMRVGRQLACESYGVKVAEPGGEQEIISNLTVSIARIDGLMELLTRNAVGPAGLRDVVSDWL